MESSEEFRLDEHTKETEDEQSEMDKTNVGRGSIGDRPQMPLPFENISEDRLSRSSISSDELPQTFSVKYLGSQHTTGLWGIKHTRRPVDNMVAAAKGMKLGTSLPFLRLSISEEGVDVTEMPQNTNKDFEECLHPIHTVSYGVQDIVYTRVFAMITVKDPLATHTNRALSTPFMCHAFVCNNSASARKLTYSLATAFKTYASSEKAQSMKEVTKKFAIDLRSKAEIEAEMKSTEIDDSEA